MSVATAVLTCISLVLVIISLISLWVWGDRLGFIRDNSPVVKYIITGVLSFIGIICLLFFILSLTP